MPVESIDSVDEYDQQGTLLSNPDVILVLNACNEWLKAVV